MKLRNIDVLIDPNLSYKAKAIMLYIIAQGENCAVNLEHLASLSTDGITSVRAGFKELVETGYIARHIEREGGKIVGFRIKIIKEL